MKISILKEIKAQEGRVALLPDYVKKLVDAGHEVYVAYDAGLISGASDDDYRKVGAHICSNEDAYNSGTLILKVKEILPEEFCFLKPDHIILTNIHAAADKTQLDVLLDKKLSAISLENTYEFGSPNCPLAGEVGALEGVRLSLSSHGGTGRHFMKHYGAQNSKAIVIGLGQVGRGALRTLLKLGVSVTGFDVSKAAMRDLSLEWSSSDFTAKHVDKIGDYLADADMIFNCVLWPKEREDYLISRNMMQQLKPTCVIIDIACDSQGAIETCRTTTWDEPTYVDEGITHFCVDNIPGSVPMTASAGNGNANIEKILLIANKGVINAVKEDKFLAAGLTCHAGELILKEAGIVQKRDYTDVEEWVANN